jgi:hypothetical protein
MENDPKTSLSIELTEETYRKLEVIAFEKGRKITDLLEDLLDEHITNSERVSD